MSEKYDNLLQKMDLLEAENKTYKKQVAILENRLEVLEKNSHSTCMEIRNIPKLTKDVENRETYIKYLNCIANTVGLETEIADTQIRNVYRAKSDTIFVDFTLTVPKENLISGIRKYNKDAKTNEQEQLSTKRIDLPGPGRPIYVSEVLTTRNRKLGFLARNLIKEKKIFATWISYGRIFIKKRDGDDPLRINSEEDLKKLGL